MLQQSFPLAFSVIKEWCWWWVRTCVCVCVCVQATVSKHMCCWIFQLLKWQHLQQKWAALYIFALNAVALDSNWLVGGYWEQGGGGRDWTLTSGVCMYIYIYVSLKFSTSCPMNWSGFSHEENGENDFFPLLRSIPRVKWGLDHIWLQLLTRN